MHVYSHALQALLATEVSRGLQRRVGASQAASGEGWDEALFRLRRYNLDWTEYTLYWTYACLTGLADTMHTPAAALRLYEESAFDWGAWQAWDAPAAFRDESFVFTVIQSIGGVDPAWVDRTVEPFFA